MRRRAHISFKTKLAATLCEMLTDDGTGKLVKIIPHEDAVKMTEDQVLSLFRFDHGLYHAQGGSDEFWNLTPMLIEAHNVKTRQRDIPQIAKTHRIEKAEEEFRTRLLAKDRGEPRPPSRWPKRKMRTR
ncbi:hypothetical protein J4G43_046950 [Bradyrhizobium barranii subsp. barranii]|uniref:Uncharacterized protein n=1 Tax=Bradyrhizobium barranii subsp. barranii TaxID=2823807 RepID=A0A939MEY3_9BRAD|nr:hypothetical protein [Bradyrhizobium barranii]UEM11907.1 hypothetical protein J4G43_046950 [Bradyrhizobium barranii subsp. barranii]